MPRAHRHFLPGYVWHITHRCHKQDFLLKFARDCKRWQHWLFETKKRYGLCVLNYVVTSNHIHLLVMDTGNNTIARSMQLVAGRTAQEYNQRKGRKGAFWEDRYYATAVETDTHLAKCLIYIDLNMVRAGVVSHPEQWPHSGYHEIQRPGQRYRIINRKQLAQLCGLSKHTALASVHKQWLEHELHNHLERKPCWSESIAVGSKSFIDDVQKGLGIRANGRHCESDDSGYVLRESASAYRTGLASEKDVLSQETGDYWDD